MFLNTSKRIDILTKQLTPENTCYYKELIHYIDAKNKLDTSKEKQFLLEILQKIIQAQDEGKDIKSVFGNEPKVTSEHLLTEFSIRQEKTRTITHFLFLIFISFVQYELFNTLLEPILTIGLLGTAVPLLLLILATFFLFKTFKAGVPSKTATTQNKQLLYPILTAICWLGFVLIPMIDTKLNGYTMNKTLSHQSFAVFLFIFSSICLLFQLQQKTNYTLIGITVFFIVFDIFVFIGTIQPIYIPSTSKTIVSLLLLLIISVGPFIEQKLKRG